MKERNINKVTLLNEDDEATDFEIVATLKIDQTEYAILRDISQQEDSIFRVEIDDEAAQFTLVDEAEEARSVIDAYYEL